MLDGSRLRTGVGTTVQGGTLSTTGSGVILPGHDSTLDGVTLQGRVLHTERRNVSIVNGLTNNGTWEMNPAEAYAVLTFTGDQTLGGSGEVAMSDYASNIIQTSGGATLTQGAGHTIRGAGQITAALDNKGTVHANQASNIILGTNAKVNDGTFKASNGATLSVNVDVSGSGDWVADGGNIQLNAGVDASGGDISVRNGGKLALNNAKMTATNLTMDATASLDVGSTVSLSGDLAFAMNNEGLFAWDAGATLEMTGGVGATIGDWPDWARLEIGGRDLGTDPDNHVGDPAGYVDNFSLSELVVGEDAHVLLLDLLDNGNRDEDNPFGVAEALYVDTLVFADGLGRLNTNGLHLYYKNLVGDPSQIQIIPLPPAVWLLGSALVGLGLIRRRRVAA